VHPRNVRNVKVAHNNEANAKGKGKYQTEGEKTSMIYVRTIVYVILATTISEDMFCSLTGHYKHIMM